MIDEKVLVFTFSDQYGWGFSGKNGIFLNCSTDVDDHWYGSLCQVFRRVMRYDIYKGANKNGICAVNREIIEIVQTYLPKYVFYPCNFSGIITETTLIELRKMGCIVVADFFDDDILFPLSRCMVPCLDYVITHGRRLVAEYIRLGARCVWTPIIPLNPTTLCRLRKGEKLYDATFLGSLYRYRSDYLSDIAAHGAIVSYLGGGNENKVSSTRLVEIFNHSRINLNFSSGQVGRHLIVGRVFEVPLCGGFLLTEYFPNLELRFEIGREIECFKTAQEAAEKIKYYLEHSDEREQIAARGYERAQRDYAGPVVLNKVFAEIEDDLCTRGRPALIPPASGTNKLRQTDAEEYFKWVLALLQCPPPLHDEWQATANLVLATNPEHKEANRLLQQAQKVVESDAVVGNMGNDDLPFMNETEKLAIVTTLRLFSKPISVLEWGSGNSTLYFPGFMASGSEWDSFEHNLEWANRGKALVEKSGYSNIRIHFIPTNKSYQEGFLDGDFETFRDYILYPEKLRKLFQIIIVDGRARVDCMKNGWDLLDANGIMILHDAQRREYDKGIPEECYWIRIVNPLISREGNVSTLFMSKSLSMISQLQHAFNAVIPEHIVVSNNMPILQTVLCNKDTKQSPDIIVVKAETDHAGKTSENNEIRYPKEFEELIPSTFTVETVLGCNLKCPECAIGGGMITRPKGCMTFDQFKIIADKIRPYVKYLLLHNWGEPMLNKDIIPMIKYASTFTKTNISTNGMSLTEQKAEDLITSGVTDLLVSVDGVSQEVYEHYRVGGKVEKAFSALAMLQRFNQKYGNKVNISPQFIAFKHNQHEMKTFLTYCQSIGLQASFKAPYIRKPSQFQNSDIRELVRSHYPNPESLRQAMRNCPDVRNAFTILLDGSSVACCYDHNMSICFGNIFENDVLEIWNSSKYREFRRNVISGNAPSYCVGSCLFYVLEEQKTLEIASQIMAVKSSVSRVDSVPNKATDQADHFCLFLNTYYEAFIKGHYQRTTSLLTQSYLQQKQSLQLECFGDSDFYSEGLKKAGLSADELIINCSSLQRAWANENSYSGEGLSIAIEQIRRAAPSIVYIQDMNMMSREFLTAIRPFTHLIVGQIATPIVVNIPFELYDIVFTSFPHYVQRFREQGITAYYQPLAFDSRVLEVVTTYKYDERPFRCSFVGGVSQLHIESYKLLETLAKETPIEFWGYGVGTLSAGSSVLKKHHGETWGKDMFGILAASQITVNRHGEVAENFTNNMRLFEATGCGALLLTDYKDNLDELFEIGKEVVAFRSPEECVALINYYLEHPEAAAAIASAGQARTLRDHTYTKRMAQTAEILERHLCYKREKDRFASVDMKGISCGYVSIEKSQIEASMTSAWKNEKIPERQRALVQNELSEMYRGRVATPYCVLADIMKQYVSPGCSVLEIGCASGYYYEILEYLLNKRINYTGVDYSDALIDMAKNYYPMASFHVADGDQLPFEDREFYIAISSGVLLHTPNYPVQIAETVRVAERFVVAHRTPVCRSRTTQYMKKLAYGVETVEILFNETALLAEFKSQGLNLLNSNEFYASPQRDEYAVTYIFEKRGSLT